MKKFYWALLAMLLIQVGKAQNSIEDYTMAMVPVAVAQAPGIHSYVFAQHDGEWLIIGGRLDGLHPRQPFRAFAAAQSNTDIFVISPMGNQVWSASVNALPTAIKEQLQSTNMNFYQDGDTLYIIGGYGFSATANDHVTHPRLTAIQVSGLMQAIKQQAPIAPYIKQVTHPSFAVTGAQLGKIGPHYFLVGGHRFEGRYNPMNGPSFVQTYTNQIRKFSFQNSSNQLIFNYLDSITDPIHLHRRDYNLVPQIYPDGSFGYLISSGVFQVQADLPFLYPVEVNATGYRPVQQFNQYLSNYHSGKVAVFDAHHNEMHSLFFGGISQYYYANGQLVQDNQVPFVKTISRLTRRADSSYQEVVLPVELPALRGASSEFFINKQLPLLHGKIVDLNSIATDSILLGHLYGGIVSPERNPFFANNTDVTSPDNGVLAIYLVKKPDIKVAEIDGENPYAITVAPNPFTGDSFVFETTLRTKDPVYFFVSNAQGQLIHQGRYTIEEPGFERFLVELPEGSAAGVYSFSVVFENKFYVTKRVVKM